MTLPETASDAGKSMALDVPIGADVANFPTIYHGTPLTPRAALEQFAGRAFCVSFYRPDDVEVVQAISPAIMFRQWRVLILAISSEKRAGMGSGSGLDAILQMARTTFAGWPMGSDTGQPRRAFADQRWIAQRLAIRAMGSAPVAHGQPDRSAVAALRQIRTGLLGLDRDGQGFGSWLRGMVSSDGRGSSRLGQSVASYSHDARRDGGKGVSLSQRGQHIFSTERTFI